jgi:hypothetical protein
MTRLGRSVRQQPSEPEFIEADQACAFASRPNTNGDARLASVDVNVEFIDTNAGVRLKKPGSKKAK